ncbi:hypothetical protein L195_g015854, partial [Trifolium pratense]
EEINEDIKSHGEWLTVTRRRKNQAHGNQGVKNTNTNSKNIKNVNLPKQSNPSHNNLAHNTNIAKHNNQTLPPRPRASEISRNNNSSLDPKRRRQDSEHVPAISLPTPINNQAILPVPILKQPVKNNTTTTEKFDAHMTNSMQFTHTNPLPIQKTHTESINQKVDDSSQLAKYQQDDMLHITTHSTIDHDHYDAGKVPEAPVDKDEHMVT